MLGIDQANKVMMMAAKAYRTLFCLIIWFLLGCATVTAVVGTCFLMSHIF
jgi:hypothetical protein